MEYLLKMKRKKNRSAFFICSLSTKYLKENHYSRRKIMGKISNKILGNKGFGYDSIFIPESHSITFGQMAKRKN